MLSPWCTLRIACGFVSCLPPLSKFEIAYLSKDVAHFKHFQLGATCLVFGLVHGICHDNLVQRTRIDTIDRVAAQYAVGDQRVHCCGTFLFEKLRSSRNGIRGICQVVDEDGGTLLDFSDKHHGGILTVADLCRAAFLMVGSVDYSKFVVSQYIPCE